MKQFHPEVPFCHMCGFTHWPGAPHIFEDQPDQLVPALSDPPAFLVPDPLIMEPVQDESTLVTVSPPTTETVDQKPSGVRQTRSEMMRARWAEKRRAAAAADAGAPIADAIADAAPVPDWMEQQD